MSAVATRPQRLGVGILGAGPVTQAIHLPTLARLSEQFTVAVVMDVEADLAERVAARAGARATTDQDAVLSADDVDVVLICSPPQFHAAQVRAACAAGVRAILCEKPLAATPQEAEQIAADAAASGVPIIVGAMHAYDPGWLAALRAFEEVTAHSEVIAVRSSIVLPPNPRYEDRATQIINRPAPRALDLQDPTAVAGAARNLVLGLTVHDLPLVRALVPTIDAVTATTWLPPYGAHISVAAPQATVELLAVMHRHWRPEWTLQAWTTQHALEVTFAPSYVHAGSAVATVTGPQGSRTFGPLPFNGYEGEWRHLHEVATGRSEPRYATSTVVEDLRYVLTVAEGASAAVLAASSADAAAPHAAIDSSTESRTQTPGSAA